MTIGGGDLVEIGERGFISDTRSGALVAADGTIDWWCPGRYDAAPLFTRLVDAPGACIRVGPAAPARPPGGTQSYVDGTLVLQTTLAGQESLVEITDFIAWDSAFTSGRLIRRLRVLRGPADVVVEVVPGAPGGGPPRRVAVWSAGVAFDGTVVSCGLPMALLSVPPPAPARPRRRLLAHGQVTLDTGEEMVVTIDPPGSYPDALSVDGARHLESRTATAWRRVADRVEVNGRYGAAAVRSALVVRALSGVGGAPVSAPVTSLPRVVGGERNSDGRLVAPVTAAAWAEAAFASGLGEEADAATGWLMGALELEPPLPAELAPEGELPPAETHLADFGGWRGSQPVVWGSNAPERASLEPAAAAVAAAARLARGPAGPAVLRHWDQLVTHADWIAEAWHGSDASVWDSRGPDRRWWSPRLAARRALAAAAAEARRRYPLDLDAAGWHVAVREIERWVREDGIGPTGVLLAGAGAESAAASAMAGGVADAALLRVAWWGPWPPDDEVVEATTGFVTRRLGHGPWLYPYPAELDDGLPGTEPASIRATLWLARALASAGRWDEAHERLEAVLALAGSLHLLSESVDATAAAPLGNRPSAAAHVALIEAALALAAAPN